MPSSRSGVSLYGCTGRAGWWGRSALVALCALSRVQPECAWAQWQLLAGPVAPAASREVGGGAIAGPHWTERQRHSLAVWAKERLLLGLFHKLEA
mmetsp:Transcript_21529/g.43616  ORF Transcript_21529/g.43616 Transcript_21529/m.43616 type:complete len:95 (-) Transcript_21529:361-645(-)